METYCQKKREKHSKQMKEWRIKHPDKIKEYRKKHATKQAEYYKKWYEENGRNRTERDLEKVLEWTQAHPDRIKIMSQLNHAVKSGKIKRPKICPRCKREARVHAHHINYTHYMNFIWLCASCHKKEHNNMS